VTYQELLTGLKRLPDGKRKDMIADFFHHFVTETFPVIEYDRSAAIMYSDLFAECEKSGKVRPYSDTQIAASAKSSNMILITRNIEDFKPFEELCGLLVENWFEE
jgi:tRNA(fMet)-specific endonuclease VapC